VATYLLFLKWTEQGIQNVKDTVNRSRQARNEFDRRGIKTGGVYWLQSGLSDALVIAETDDEKAIAAATLAVKSLGNVRIEMVRAFGEQEMQAIVEKI
jgi:uncharacterized protein with GYD domain